MHTWGNSTETCFSDDSCFLRRRQRNHKMHYLHRKVEVTRGFITGHKQPITADMYTRLTVYIRLHTCLSSLLDSWLLYCRQDYLLGWPAASWLLAASHGCYKLVTYGIGRERGRQAWKRRYSWWTLLATVKIKVWESTNENHRQAKAICTLIIISINN